MESRIIYESGKFYLQKVNWKRPKESSDSEWVYIGDEESMDRIAALIQSFFIADQLHVVFNRHNSFKTDKGSIIEKIKLFIGNENFSVWDVSFQNVIEFNKIGVYRTGIY